MNKLSSLRLSETTGHWLNVLTPTALVCLAMLLLVGLANTVAATSLEKWSTLMQNPAKVYASLPPLDFDNPHPPSPEILTYFNAYGFNAPGYEHIFGTFESGDFTLAAHAYRQDSPRGTVILMHGFFDHSGTIAQTIHHLLEQGFAVAAYDMPGHGLSSGRAAHIDDFADYGRSLEDFINLCMEHMSPPFQVIAHSTGAAVLVTRLLSHPEKEEFKNIVLVSPLVRSAYWHLSGISANFFDIFMQDVPRVFRDNSSDENFLKAVRNDPLQARQTSFEWMDALIAWNKRIAAYPASQQPILIIQGNEDSVVDWDYNLEFLGEKFPNASIEMIDKGRHQLLGETPILREEVYRLIDQWLEN